jgi:tripartite-type tricarboxylate transporter receptor subunit TctC
MRSGAQQLHVTMRADEVMLCEVQDASRRALRGAIIMVAVVLGATDAAAADPYPSRVVKLIVPIAAGGPVDTVARAVAQTLSERLRHTFVVENRPGAGGNLGIQAAIQAPPDGHTLVMALGSMLAINPAIYRKAPFDPDVDLHPLSILTVSSQMLVVHPSLPATSLAEFIALAKREPVTYAISGYGSPSHLAMEYLRMLAGFTATPVSYRGNAPLVSDLVAGEMKVGFVATSGVIEHVRADKLRGLGISGAKRSALAPAVPTIAEAGYRPYQFDSAILILAPAGIPQAIADLVEDEARRAVQTPEFQERFRARDISSVGSTSTEARAWIGAERRRWGEVVRAAGILVD